MDVAYFCFCSVFLSCLRDAKLKKIPNIQNKFRSGWVGARPLQIENWKTEIKIKMIVYFWVLNTVKILSQNCTLLISRHYMY